MRKKRAKQLKAKVISDAKEKGVVLNPMKLEYHYNKLKKSYKTELAK